MVAVSEGIAGYQNDIKSIEVVRFYGCKIILYKYMV
jgi:hydroxymethylpyrimidine/phosphomethylpyrimidine kinase